MSPADKLPLAKNPVPELSPADAARVLADAAERAGKHALSMRGKGLKTWIKGKDSPVSEADIAADEILREALSAAAPGYEWLSEESADIAGRTGHRRRWVVDPIDGTRSFIKGQSDWSISAALTEDGRPIAAVLYAPETEELFSAWAGGGAKRNGKAIAVSPRTSFQGARIAGPRFTLERLESSGFSHEAVPRIHSLALRFARAAAGDIDVAFASENSHDWDLAAADLLVHEAGGTLTGPDGVKIAYGDAEAAHPALVGASLALHPAATAALGKVLARP
jgi:myo-inositol-1(or 4)-monophosphatase